MNTTTTQAVNTGRVAGRRAVRFETIDQALAEVDRLTEAERAGRLKQLGNWTLGQILGHLAVWAEFSYTGSPLKPPFFIRWMLRLRKSAYLKNGLPAGVRIPGVEGGTLATEPMPSDDGQARLRRVLERLKLESPILPNAAFGPLTHAEWIALNLRHAELHLGFLVPQ
jgi:hypothetical protein